MCGISDPSGSLLYIDCCQIPLGEKNKGKSTKRMRDHGKSFYAKTGIFKCLFVHFYRVLLQAVWFYVKQ